MIPKSEAQSHDVGANVLTRPRQTHTTSASVEGELVYAVGDVHGCYDLLVRLLEDIARDAEVRAGDRRPILIFVGDYVDRGPASAAVLSSLLWLGRYGGMEVHFLKGNHEEMMLKFLDQPAGFRGWLGVGGAQTLRSYGVTPPEEEADAEDLWRARDDLLDRMPAAHLRFLQGLELSVQIGDYAFVHAGVRPGVALDKQRERDLLWIREGFLDCDRALSKVIVHGHSWLSDQPEWRKNRVGIDTGAYETGVLTAIRLEDDQLEIMQAGSPAQG